MKNWYSRAGKVIRPPEVRAKALAVASEKAQPASPPSMSAAQRKQRRAVRDARKKAAELAYERGKMLEGVPWNPTSTTS